MKDRRRIPAIRDARHEHMFAYLCATRTPRSVMTILRKGNHVLDSPGWAAEDSVMPTPEDLTYRDKVLRIADLIGPEMSLVGLTFVGCHIKGPAVLYLRDTNIFLSRIGTEDIDAAFWYIPD